MTMNRRIVVIIAAVVVVLVVAAVIFAIASTQRWILAAVAQPPSTTTAILAPEQSKARDALSGEKMDARERAAAEYLADQPTAYWLTPEQDPIGTAGKTVSSLTTQARDQEVAMAIVIYGLPERDCGNHSAGGLSGDDYRTWIDEISAALEAAPDVQKLVILEPDSLALAPECGNLDERAAQLRSAVHELTAPHTWIYLDGGHSAWLPAAEMASLIEAVDVADEVRGFATNVSNYRPTYDEFTYAHAVAAQLHGMHAVIDTSRNGGSVDAGAQWCNPPDQRVGEPSGTFGDEVVDLNLWIKPPGESDGPCEGGPAAGVWWPAAAAELAQDAR